MRGAHVATGPVETAFCATHTETKALIEPVADPNSANKPKQHPKRLCETALASTPQANFEAPNKL